METQLYNEFYTDSNYPYKPPYHPDGNQTTMPISGLHAFATFEDDIAVVTTRTLNGSQTIPNAVDTPVRFDSFEAARSIGESGIIYNAQDASFTNSLNRCLVVNVGFNITFDTVLNAGDRTVYIQHVSGTTTTALAHSTSGSAVKFPVCGNSAVLVLQPGDKFAVHAMQDSGLSVDVSSVKNKPYIQISVLRHE
jgi:hypothetical protein